VTISSEELKRQIIQSAPKSAIKKEMEKARPSGIPDDEQIGWGEDLQDTTKTKGFALMESFMHRKMNILGIVMNNEVGQDVQKGVAKGYIELMQWIELMIQKKDEILERERTKHEAKTVPED
jgi:hypothetical protein